jgi:hypothetical protein
MTDKWTKAGALAALQAGRSQWEAVLAQVGAAWMTEPLQAGEWSIKDIIAHITWYEQQTALVLQPHAGPGPDRNWLWAFTAEKRNMILFTAHRDLLLPDVRAEAHEAYGQLVAAVQALTVANLRDAQRFPDMPHG